jgi:hypothetical protein
VPASEENLMRYVAYLSSSYNPRSIPVYMAAVKAFHVNLGLPYPPSLLRTKIMIRGLQRGAAPPDQKQPITFHMLTYMYLFVVNSYESCMMWAAMTTAFFGCLRADELLRLTDVRFNRLADGTRYCQVAVPVAKCDVQGFTRTIGCSDHTTCSYCALLYYVKMRTSIRVSTNLLFVCANGLPLSHSSFVKHVRNMVSRLGLNPRNFSGHSFRIGSASTAGAQNFRDWEIQLLGGWRSEAFKRYVRSRIGHAARFASRLAGPHT